MQKIWPSTHAHLALAAEPLAILRIGSKPYCYLLLSPHHCEILCFPFSYTVKTSFCRNCSKSSYPLLSTSWLHMHHQYGYLPFSQNVPSMIFINLHTLSPFLTSLIPTPPLLCLLISPSSPSCPMEKTPRCLAHCFHFPHPCSEELAPPC